MKNYCEVRLVLVLIFVVMMVTVSRGYTDQPARDPVLVKERYNTIVSNLDTGGDLLVVVNIEGLIEETIKDMIKIISVLPVDDSGVKTIKDIAEKTPAFLKKNGFYAIQGLGISAVPRADGLNTVKYFISRDPAAAGLPLWQGFVGLKRCRLKSLDFLPVDTVMAQVTNTDIKQLWKIVRAGVKELAPPEASAVFDKALIDISIKQGIDIDKLINSLDDEGFISIQFSREAKAAIPVPSNPSEPLQIPVPSILIGSAVKDDMLIKIIEAQLGKLGMPAVKTQVEETVLRSINLPPMLPVPIQPTYTVHSGIFLLGSNPQVVTDAITAFQKKNGLAFGPEFKKAFEGLPMVNKGITYMSPRFSKIISDIQMKMMPAASQKDEAFTNTFRSLVNKRGEQSCAFVTLNLKSGILTKGRSSSGGQEIITSITMTPIATGGMLAAIAIPSLMKARTTARLNTCKAQRMAIMGAIERYAMDNNLGESDRVIDKKGDDANSGWRSFLKDGIVPICSKGTEPYTYDKEKSAPGKNDGTIEDYKINCPNYDEIKHNPY
jgi:Tfp pilus assembly protein PilE